MLTSLSVSASGTQIVKRFSASGGNVVYYTVPAGKTFTGYYFPKAAEYNYLKINGVDIQLTNSGTYWGYPMPLTLTAGTTIGSSASYYEGTLVGIES